MLALAPGVRLVEPSPDVAEGLGCTEAASLFVYDFVDYRCFAVADLRFADLLRMVGRGVAKAEALALLRSFGEDEPEAVVDGLLQRGLVTYALTDALGGKRIIEEQNG